MIYKNKNCFDSLAVINIELTSFCNKDTCLMCGRRKIEREYPELVDWGHMPFDLVEKIAKQLPSNIITSLHNNGEPTTYPRLGEALQLFKKQIRHFDSNCKLIVEKADEIIDNLEALTVSVVQDDIDDDEQYEIVKQFLDIKGEKKPTMTYRLLGNINKRERWERLPGLIANRTIHSPMGSFEYKTRPTIPEHGLCLDLLTHLAIDRYGKVSPCVRFDPKRLGIIGDVNKTPLIDIWNGPERKEWIQAHLEQRRDKIPLCSYCTFYGVATSD